MRVSRAAVPSTRQTNWPCTSSQMRTQRQQEMHRRHVDVDERVRVVDERRTGPSCARRLEAVRRRSSWWNGSSAMRPPRRPGTSRGEQLEERAAQRARSPACACRRPCRRATGVVHAATGRGSAVARPRRRAGTRPRAPDAGSSHSVGDVDADRRAAASRIGQPVGDLVRRARRWSARGMRSSSSPKCASTLRANAARPVPWPHRLVAGQGRRRGRRHSPSRPPAMPSASASRSKQSLDARGADPARRALAARLVRAEAEHVMHELGDRGVLVEGDDATVADLGTDAPERLERRAGCRGGDAGARRPAARR